MPDNDLKKKPRPINKLPPDRFQPKVLLIWLAIIAAVLALFYLPSAKFSSPVSLKIQQVVEKTEHGDVKEGVIHSDPSGGRDWVTITGKLKEEVDVPGGKTNEFVASGRLTDDSLEKLQKASVFSEQPATNTFTTLLGNIIPFLIIIGLAYFIIVRQLRNAGRGALNFGKSRARLLTRDRDKVTFSEVAGCDEAKEEISEVVEFLKDPKKFTRMGGRIPKGILLVGPPGTGKTLLAKAVAGEADVPFFSVSGSDFVEMFVGVGASRVRDMFEQGRKNAPCIIFIDEIDAVGRQRGAGLGGGNDEREQTLNSLLVEMDGFDTTEGVIIVAATNRPDVLDNALLRPGRFDRQIYVDLPDLQGREQILKVHAKKINLADGVDLSVIARGTPGLSGAELANLLNEGALLAARQNKKKVDIHDLDAARDKVQFGRERRRLMDDEEKKLTAYHEAGHALVQAVLDDGTMPVHKVTIIPRGRALGLTMFIPKKDLLTRARRRVLVEIATGLAGRIAEDIVIGDISNGAYGDIKYVTKLARHMVCDWGMSPLGPISYSDNQDTVFLGREIARTEHVSEETARRIDAEVQKIVSEQEERARSILIAKREALDKMAAALIEYETIEGKHVHEILEFGEIRTPVVRVTPLAPEKPADKHPPETSTTPVPPVISAPNASPA